MLNHNLMQQIDRMSIQERVALMEYLARSVQQDMKTKSHRRKGSSLDRVMGALRQPGQPAPDDEEVQKMITDFLLEKHARCVRSLIPTYSC